jgi:hypothetical protein
VAVSAIHKTFGATLVLSVTISPAAIAPYGVERAT